MLLSAVAVVNCGYWLLSRASSLPQALWANRLSYLGSVFLPAIMLLIILKESNLRLSRRLPLLLAALGAAVFALAASPGLLTVYYKEVTLVSVNGVSALSKVYGPLHGLYGVYLLCYFSAMVGSIIYAAVKKTVSATGHTVILAISVFVNLAVWFIEQLVKLDFEFLAISYIISELFLLGLHLMLREQARLQAPPLAAADASASAGDAPEASPSAADQHRRYLDGLAELTPTEWVVLDSYIAHMTSREIMETLHIKENTLKFHNKNLYHKLSVSSRKEMLELYRQLEASDPRALEAIRPRNAT